MNKERFLEEASMLRRHIDKAAEKWRTQHGQPPGKNGDRPVDMLSSVKDMEAAKAGKGEFLGEKGSWRINKELGHWECDRPKTELEELITSLEGSKALQEGIKDPEILSACIGLPEIIYGAHASLAANPALSKEDVLRLSSLGGIGFNEDGASFSEALCSRDNLDLETIWELNKAFPSVLRKNLPYSDNYDKRCVFFALNELKKWDGPNPPQFMDFQDHHDLNVKEGLQHEVRSSLGRGQEDPMDNITQEEAEQLKGALVDRQPYELKAGLRWGAPWLKAAIVAAESEKPRLGADLTGNPASSSEKENVSGDLMGRIENLRGGASPRAASGSPAPRPLSSPQGVGNRGLADQRALGTSSLGAVIP